MADSKETKLSIVIRTVDQATAKIKAINDRLDAITKPTRDFKKALSDLREKSGLDGVISGFKGVGSAVGDLLSKVAVIGGITGGAVAGLFHLVNEFDELGDKAERFGVGVDFLAEMRYAAEKAGAPVESLDSGLQSFSENLGKARAGTGRMLKFLNQVSPAFAKQLVGAKSNEEAFDDLAVAMSKLTDPAKRSALALATVGNSDLAPLFAKGAKGVKELRDRYLQFAGSQEKAADEAGKVDDAMHDLKASTDGVKAAIVVGLAPALKVLVDRLREWFQGHRADIAEWAKSIGEKLPGAVQKIVTWIGEAVDKVTAFVDAIGGLKNVAIGAGLVLAGPLIGSILSLSGALLTALTRAGLLGTALSSLPAGAGAAGGAGGAAAGGAGFLGPAVLAVGGAYALSELTGGAGGKRLLDQAQEFAKRGQRPGGDTFFDKAERSVGGLPQADVLSGFNPPDLTRPDVSAQARSAMESKSSSEAKITVDFANAPRGTRVSTDPQSTADVDLSVGYQMLGTSP